MHDRIDLQWMHDRIDPWHTCPATPIRPESRVVMAILNPMPSSPRRLSFGTLQPSMMMFAVDDARIPSLSSFLPREIPGESIGTTNALIPLINITNRRSTALRSSTSCYEWHAKKWNRTWLAWDPTCEPCRYDKHGGNGCSLFYRHSLYNVRGNYSLVFFRQVCCREDYCSLCLISICNPSLGPV